MKNNQKVIKNVSMKMHLKLEKVEKVKRTVKVTCIRTRVIIMALQVPMNVVSKVILKNGLKERQNSKKNAILIRTSKCGKRIRRTK